MLFVPCFPDKGPVVSGDMGSSDHTSLVGRGDDYATCIIIGYIRIAIAL